MAAAVHGITAGLGAHEEERRRALPFRKLWHRLLLTGGEGCIGRDASDRLRRSKPAARLGPYHVGIGASERSWQLSQAFPRRPSTVAPLGSLPTDTLPPRVGWTT